LELKKKAKASGHTLRTGKEKNQEEEELPFQLQNPGKRDEVWQGGQLVSGKEKRGVVFDPATNGMGGRKKGETKSEFGGEVCRLEQRKSGGVLEDKKALLFRERREKKGIRNHVRVSNVVEWTPASDVQKTRGKEGRG